MTEVTEGLNEPEYLHRRRRRLPYRNSFERLKKAGGQWTLSRLSKGGLLIRRLFYITICIYLAVATRWTTLSSSELLWACTFFLSNSRTFFRDHFQTSFKSSFVVSGNVARFSPFVCAHENKSTRIIVLTSIAIGQRANLVYICQSHVWKNSINLFEIETLIFWNSISPPFSTVKQPTDL
mgnify:CR=1 FL=1